MDKKFDTYSNSASFIETNKPTKVRWQIFVMLFFLVAINYVDRSALSVALPMITKDLKLDPAITGVILSSFFWGYALMQIPCGILVDKFKPSGLVVGSTIAWGIAQLFTGFTTGGKSLVFLRFLLGVTEAPIYPAGGKLQSIWLTSKERGRGATLLDSGSPLGMAIGGPLVVTFIAWFGGWRSALIATGVLTILIGLIAWRVIRGNPSSHPRVNDAERKYLKESLDEEYEEEKNHSNYTITFRDYLKNSTFWLVCISYFAYCTVYYGLMTWGPMYLSQTQSLDINSIGGAIFIIFGAGFVGELLGGWLADKLLENGVSYNRIMRTIIATSGLLTAISIFLLGYIASLKFAIILLALALFFLRWCGLFWSVPAAISQRKFVGLVGGCMSFSGNVAGIVTPIIIGFIVSITHSYFIALMIFVIASIILAGSVIMIDFSRKIGHKTI